MSQINLGVISPDDFICKENNAILLNDEARRNYLRSWEKRKHETITHPFLGEKVEWGLVPYVQAMLFARWLRGDFDTYPPFFWK